MSLRKTATKEAPHATYKADGWTWLVLKVNAPKKSPRSPYASWFVAVKAPGTFGGWDMGDNYAIDILRSGRPVQQTDEFRAYLEEHE